MHTPMWAYWLSLGGGVPAVGIGDDLPAADSPAVSDLDAELIQLAYEVIAAESACDLCGARSVVESTLSRRPASVRRPLSPPS